MYPYIIAAVTLVILLGALVYYYLRNKKEEPSPGPSPGPSSGGDEIIITNEGSKFGTPNSGTETYISMPLAENCYGGDGDPSFCSDITPTTEMKYVLDITGGGIDNYTGGFKTSFNTETNLCADGTRDCVYEEQFDENRKLIGIKNSKGEDFIQKFIDGIYSGALDIDTNVRAGDDIEFNLREMFKSMTNFDTTTGKLLMKYKASWEALSGAENPTVIEIIPGNTRDDTVIDGKVKMPVGQMIMLIIIYYYVNDLPKPTIKLDLSSEETYGQIHQRIGSIIDDEYLLTVLDRCGRTSSDPQYGLPSCGSIEPITDDGRCKFPAHWGEPPFIETADIVEFPEEWKQYCWGLGNMGGSSTKRNWIQENLDNDKDLYWIQ